MEKECLVLGKVNAGKTLFIVNFADYLEIKELNFFFFSPDGKEWVKKYSLSQAKNSLVDYIPHKTRCLQKISADLPVGKGKKQFKLVDSSGFIEGIHEDKEIRQGIAQTLSEIEKAKVILHLIDVSALGKVSDLSEIGELDFQIAKFASLKGSYAILANKIDLSKAEVGLKKLKIKLPETIIIPISAKLKTGFKEVRTFVNRCI